MHSRNLFLTHRLTQPRENPLTTYLCKKDWWVLSPKNEKMTDPSKCISSCREVSKNKLKYEYRSKYTACSTPSAFLFFKKHCSTTDLHFLFTLLHSAPLCLLNPCKIALSREKTDYWKTDICAADHFSSMRTTLINTLSF